MTNPTIRIHNAETGEIIDREMTDEEIAQRNYVPPELAKEYAADKKRKDAEAIRKAALLEKLGITAEEAVLLLS